ncbi:hypothetical protein C8F04DRAFT_1183147 [Mycena alexandri]|uniref:Uncharacterized protein n=1 Tax=Mycena alexandri TaxID=1745969 RepID=A0AAD6SWA3_9AGAR|nr:hypothetical protein C8F04DRAFT_1183147 [Mycena alexandri]
MIGGQWTFFPLLRGFLGMGVGGNISMAGTNISTVRYEVLVALMEAVFVSCMSISDEAQKLQNQLFKQNPVDFRFSGHQLRNNAIIIIISRFCLGLGYKSHHGFQDRDYNNSTRTSRYRQQAPSIEFADFHPHVLKMVGEAFLSVLIFPSTIQSLNSSAGNWGLAEAVSEDITTLDMYTRSFATIFRLHSMDPSSFGIPIDKLEDAGSLNREKAQFN